MPARLEAARTMSRRALIMGTPWADVRLRLPGGVSDAIAMPGRRGRRGSSGVRGFAAGAGPRAAGGSLMRSSRRAACGGGLGRVSASVVLRAPLEAGLQGGHEIDHVSAGHRPRLGHRHLAALDLALDRRLDPRLDLIRIRRGIEAVRALLRDELAGEL